MAHLKEKIRAEQKVANFASPKELGDLILRDMKAAIEEDYRGKNAPFIGFRLGIVLF